MTGGNRDRPASRARTAASDARTDDKETEKQHDILDN
jgi:hypothetical protein